MLAGLLLISILTINIKVSEAVSIKTSITNTNNGDSGTFKSNKFSFNYPGGWSMSVKDTTINKDSSTFIKLTHGNEKVKIMLYQSNDVYGVDSYSFMKVFENAESNNFYKYSILDQDNNSYMINSKPTNNLLIEYQGNDGDGKVLDIFKVIDDKIFVLRYYSPDISFEQDNTWIKKLLKSIKIF